MQETSVQARVQSDAPPSWLTETAKRLRELPRDIFNAEQEYDSISQQHISANRTLDAIENNLAIAIQSEIDSTTNKPRYANAEARKAELLNRRVKEQAWVEAYKTFAEIERAKDLKQNEVNRLSNEFGAVKQLANLYAAWLYKQSSVGSHS